MVASQVWSMGPDDMIGVVVRGYGKEWAELQHLSLWAESGQ